MMQVTYAEIVRVLQSAGSAVSPSEAHGCLCGALCTTARYGPEPWLEELIPEDDRTGEVPDQALLLLFEDTTRALRGEEMEFQPLLPDDDVALEERARMLSQWCQGFLYGFGTGQPVNQDELHANVNEILRDFTHIGRASVDVGGGGEEEEEAYAEVVEYVRVGVQLIHDELAEVREGAAASRGDTREDDFADSDDADD